MLVVGVKNIIGFCFQTLHHKRFSSQQIMCLLAATHTKKSLLCQSASHPNPSPLGLWNKNNIQTSVYHYSTELANLEPKQIMILSCVFQF